VFLRTARQVGSVVIGARAVAGGGWRHRRRHASVACICQSVRLLEAGAAADADADAGQIITSFG